MREYLFNLNQFNLVGWLHNVPNILIIKPYFMYYFNDIKFQTKHFVCVFINKN